MSTETKSFSEYSVCVSTDPSYYGSDCTQFDADRIAANLSDLIKAEFPEIVVTSSGRSVAGPDEETCEDINRWIQENWTAAL